MQTSFRFTDEALPEIRRVLRTRLSTMEPGETLTIQALDPDVSSSHFGGESMVIEGESYRYRSWATWFGLAEVMGCTIATPRPLEDGMMELKLRLLDVHSAWHHTSKPSGHPEKYGSDSDFARMDKFEDPWFVETFAQAIAFTSPPPQSRVLCLGSNQGHELGFLETTLEDPQSLIGLDHSASAIAVACHNYSTAVFDFRAFDLKAIEELEDDPFDLIVAINTLHSPSLDGQAIFRWLVTRKLKADGGVILGFPNSRYIDHQLSYGARVRNYRHPEFSVLLKEASTYKRYMHQQGFQVTITGKHTVLVSGRR